MALRHALLALLEAKPMTGYELAGQFDASAAYVWHAHHPQIYTELRRMEADGLVEAEEAPRGAGATKRRYFLTDKGCDELLRWLTEESEPPRERDVAYLKATYFEFGSFDTVRRHLRGHREHYAKQAAHWSAHANQLERRDTALLRLRLAHAPRHAHAAIVAYKVHVYRGLTERAHTEVRWAEQGLELVDRLTANVWIRGILADRHDVPVSSVRYRTGGMHQPGRVEKQKLNLPPEIDIAPIAPDRTLADMLVTGEIDALYAPRTPRPMIEGRPEVRRLFTDPRAVEEQYAAETGIFPIMHVVVLRRDVYEARPWAARSLYSAFEQAKAATQERMGETAANSYMLPWLYDEVERTRRVLGPDFWPYGLDRNQETLEVFLRYAHEQGLTPRRLSPDELFAPETTETYVI